MMRIIGASLVPLVIAGCMTTNQGGYEEPLVERIDPARYTVVVDKSFDDAWSALVSHAASTFFAIENFEKDSGLMTLSFGSGEPGVFIDCGYWGSSQFSGNYADYLARYYNGTLTGKMNILVKGIDDQKSEIRVNARYIFSSPPQTWAFDTGGYRTLDIGSAAAWGSGSVRTCVPTHEAEKSILEAITD